MNLQQSMKSSKRRKEKARGRRKGWEERWRRAFGRRKRDCWRKDVEMNENPQRTRTIGRDDEASEGRWKRWDRVYYEVE